MSEGDVYFWWIIIMVLGFGAIAGLALLFG
jgi:hypothetical protein